MDAADIVALRLAEARKAHARGWLLTPLRGKRPYLKGWQAAPAPDLSTVEKWARVGNVGLRTGSASGVIVIDDDTADGSGLAGLSLPPTITVLTGSGKRHAYLRYPEGGIGNSVAKLAESVDVRGDGGQVVFVGSLHPETGGAYAWVPGRSPDDVPLAELPDEILGRLRAPPQSKPPPEAGPADSDAIPELLRPALDKYLKAVRRRECTDLLGTPEGQRNHALNRAAFRLGRYVGAGLIDEARVLSDLKSAAAAAGLEGGEIAKTIRSGLDAGIRSPVKVGDILDRIGRRSTGANVGDRDGRASTGIKTLTDTGNSERFVERFGQNTRYCHTWGQWLVWDGRRWKIDESGRTMRLSKDVARGIYDDALKTDDPATRDAICEWAKSSEKLERRRALLTLAQSEDGVPILHDELDRSPWLLNLRNGTLDLRTGARHPNARSDLITKIVEVDFDPGATCPVWNAFLERVLPDPTVRRFVQRAVGWTLTGDTSAQVLLFCYGLGANGKSVFLRTLLYLLGKDYAIQAAPELLLAKRERGHPTDQADLFGVRAAVCMEMGPGRGFDEVLVKQLTGGDLIRARRMRENFWQFEPTHHIWIGANHKPVVRGTDYAIWRRILLIPFTVTIPQEERDPALLEKLRAELPGILNWALVGAAEFQKSGLAAPEVVRAATEEYREEMDVVGSFLSEATVTVDAEVVTAARALFAAYVKWCEDCGEEAVNFRIFGLRLTERGFKRKRIKGRIHYIGIRIKPERVDDVDDGGRTSGIARSPGTNPGDAESPPPSPGTERQTARARKNEHPGSGNTESSSTSSTSSTQPRSPSGREEEEL